MAMAFDETEQVAELGEEIYETKYKAEFERKYPDHFVAIDIHSGHAFVDRYAESAIEKAFAEVSDATVHLVRIGSQSAYSMGLMLA